MMNIFDTHTHLNVDNFAGKEAEEIAKKLPEYLYDYAE